VLGHASGLLQDYKYFILRVNKALSVSPFVNNNNNPEQKLPRPMVPILTPHHYIKNMEAPILFKPIIDDNGLVFFKLSNNFPIFRN
jgi:hypothetical protein